MRVCADVGSCFFMTHTTHAPSIVSQIMAFTTVLTVYVASDVFNDMLPPHVEHITNAMDISSRKFGKIAQCCTWIVSRTWLLCTERQERQRQRGRETDRQTQR